MQRAVQVPSALIDTVLGLIVMFVVGSNLLSRRWSARRAIATAKAEGTEHVQAATETSIFRLPVAVEFSPRPSAWQLLTFLLRSAKPSARVRECSTWASMA